MSKAHPSPIFECVTCEAKIAHDPTFYVGLPFCCAGCVVGGPCICSYDEEPSHDPAEARPEPAPVDEDHGLVGAPPEVERVDAGVAADRPPEDDGLIRVLAVR